MSKSQYKSIMLMAWLAFAFAFWRDINAWERAASLVFFLVVMNLGLKEDKYG